MKISYEIFDVEGFKKRPVIVFENPAYIGLEDLLNIDSSLISLTDIMQKIVKVEKKQSSFEAIGNERVLLEIEKEYATISDMFEGLIEADELYPPICIKTLKLKKIIVEWEEIRKLLDWMIKNNCN
ncbi:hypothetical protein [Enterococcus sp. LJL51]|uniref:hypothetical protein n=1 Tax=Enterococcus sp. LJL51 TaxID=3416656 RepID=UPI003CF7C2A1